MSASTEFPVRRVNSHYEFETVPKGETSPIVNLSRYAIHLSTRQRGVFVAEPAEESDEKLWRGQYIGDETLRAKTPRAAR